MQGGTEAAAHVMHPAFRLILFLSVIQSAAVTQSFRSLAVFCIILLFATFYFKTDINTLINRSKPFILILVFTFLINLAFGSGLTISSVLTLRFLLIILFSILLTASTDPQVLIAVLLYPFRGRFGKNLKIVLMVAMELIPYFIEKAKNTVKNIKEMPEFHGQAYKAILKPELYIRPITEGMYEMASDVADGVAEGKYDTPALPRIKPFEILLSLTAVACAVIYAL
jgi:energy-coupling factor transport system permease protein